MSHAARVPRAGTSRRRLASSCGAAAVAPPAPGDRRARLTVAYDGPASTGSRRTAACVTVQAHAGAALAHASCAGPVELTGAGRTDAGVHAGARSSSSTPPAERSTWPGCERSVNGLCGPAIVVRDVELSPATTSTPASRPCGAATATRCSTGACPTRSRRHDRWHVRRRSTWRPCGSAATRSSASTTSPRSAAGRRPARRHRALAGAPHRSRPSGTTSATACCVRDQRPTRSATRWCARSSGTLVEVGLGRRRAGDLAGRPAGQGPGRRRARGPAPRAVPLGGRLPVSAGRRARRRRLATWQPWRRESGWPPSAALAARPHLPRSARRPYPCPVPMQGRRPRLDP